MMVASGHLGIHIQHFTCWMAFWIKNPLSLFHWWIAPIKKAAKSKRLLNGLRNWGLNHRHEFSQTSRIWVDHGDVQIYNSCTLDSCCLLQMIHFTWSLFWSFLEGSYLYRPIHSKRMVDSIRISTFSWKKKTNLKKATWAIPQNFPTGHAMDLASHWLCSRCCDICMAKKYHQLSLCT